MAPLKDVGYAALHKHVHEPGAFEVRQDHTRL